MDIVSFMKPVKKPITSPVAPAISGSTTSSMLIAFR
jgi:hypothetical protein